MGFPWSVAWSINSPVAVEFGKNLKVDSWKNTISASCGRLSKRNSGRLPLKRLSVKPNF